MTARDDLAEGRRLAWRRIRLLGRGARGLALLGVTLGLLALNVATLTLSGLNALASSAIAAVSALDPVSSRDRRALEAAEETAEATRRRVGDLTEEASALRRRTADLDGALRARDVELGQVRARLAATAEESRALRRSLDAARWVDLGGERMAVRDAVIRTTGRIRDRTARVATANLGSMVGESVPFYGIAVVVAATTFELASACQSMQEMRDLEAALGAADPGDGQVGEVCGLRVPSAGEVWTSIRASPGAAWDAAAGALGTLGEVDLPSPDFGGLWAGTTTWFGGWFEE